MQSMEVISVLLPKTNYRKHDAALTFLFPLKNNNDDRKKKEEIYYKADDL